MEEVYESERKERAANGQTVSWRTTAYRFLASPVSTFPAAGFSALVLLLSCCEPHYKSEVVRSAYYVVPRLSGFNVSRRGLPSPRATALLL